MEVSSFWVAISELEGTVGVGVLDISVSDILGELSVESSMMKIGCEDCPAVALGWEELVGSGETVNLSGESSRMNIGNEEDPVVGLFIFLVPMYLGMEEIMRWGWEEIITAYKYRNRHIYMVSFSSGECLCVLTVCG